LKRRRDGPPDPREVIAALAVASQLRITAGRSRRGPPADDAFRRLPPDAGARSGALDVPEEVAATALRQLWENPPGSGGGVTQRPFGSVRDPARTSGRRVWRVSYRLRGADQEWRS